MDSNKDSDCNIVWLAMEIYMLVSLKVGLNKNNLVFKSNLKKTYL